MSNYDPKVPGNDYPGRVPPRARSASSWVAGAVIVVLLLIAIGYVFNYRPGSGLVEQRAAAPDTTQTTAPMTPATTPAPETSPKP